jgi:hypothetical protein
MAWFNTFNPWFPAVTSVLKVLGYAPFFSLWFIQKSILFLLLILII